MRAVIALSTQTTPCSPPPFVCPSDAIGVKTMWLPDCSVVKVSVFSDIGRNFTDAMTKCNAENGQLLEITTVEKMTLTLNLMRCPAYESMLYWIDGVYNNATSVWETTDGKPLPMTQGDFWYPARPNDPASQSCVQMKLPTFNFLWDDNECYEFLTAICEMS